MHLCLNKTAYLFISLIIIAIIVEAECRTPHRQLQLFQVRDIKGIMEIHCINIKQNNKNQLEIRRQFSISIYICLYTILTIKHNF